MKIVMKELSFYFMDGFAVLLLIHSMNDFYHLMMAVSSAYRSLVSINRRLNEQTEK
jgi:hypothetical protein